MISTMFSSVLICVGNVSVLTFSDGNSVAASVEIGSVLFCLFTTGVCLTLLVKALFGVEGFVGFTSTTSTMSPSDGGSVGDGSVPKSPPPTTSTFSLPFCARLGSGVSL